MAAPPWAQRCRCLPVSAPPLGAALPVTAGVCTPPGCRGPSPPRTGFCHLHPPPGVASADGSAASAESVLPGWPACSGWSDQAEQSVWSGQTVPSQVHFRYTLRAEAAPEPGPSRAGGAEWKGGGFYPALENFPRPAESKGGGLPRGGFTRDSGVFPYIHNLIDKFCSKLLTRFLISKPCSPGLWSMGQAPVYDPHRNKLPDTWPPRGSPNKEILRPQWRNTVMITKIAA